MPPKRNPSATRAPKKLINFYEEDSSVSDELAIKKSKKPLKKKGVINNDESEMEATTNGNSQDHESIKKPVKNITKKYDIAQIVSSDEEDHKNEDDTKVEDIDPVISKKGKKTSKLNTDVPSTSGEPVIKKSRLVKQKNLTELENNNEGRKLRQKSVVDYTESKNEKIKPAKGKEDQKEKIKKDKAGKSSKNEEDDDDKNTKVKKEKQSKPSKKVVKPQEDNGELLAKGKAKKAILVKNSKKPVEEDEDMDSEKEELPKEHKEDDGEQLAKGKAKKAKPVKSSKKAVEEDEDMDSVKEELPKVTERKKNEVKKVEKEKKSAENRTSSDLTQINFSTSRKNTDGDEYNFKITSWNLGGLRAFYKKASMNFFLQDDADVVCFQETKCKEAEVPKDFAPPNYRGYWLSSKKDGYAGMGLMSKTEPLNVTYGIEKEEHDEDGRCITAEFEKFYLINVYVPNAGRKLVTLSKRLDWNEAFKAYVHKLDEKKPVIICGDFNVAHNEIDLANPKANTKNAGFTREERDGMTDFLESGFVDTFRLLYPDKKDVYTFWTYMANARARNVGWRLDYFLVSESLKKKVCDNVVQSELFGSDHCPITLFFNV